MTDHTVDIVDDDPSLLALFETFLSDRYDVRTATGGREALDLLGPGSDVVLLDRRLPRLSGDDVLTELRTRGLDCPVAFVTAVDPGPDIVDLPLDGYVRKPLARADARDLVETLLGVASYDDPRRELFRLRTKHAALELGGHTDTAAHEHLADRLTTLRTGSTLSGDTVSPNGGFRK
jgi:DNA-binding response OmpR family regulator